MRYVLTGLTVAVAIVLIGLAAIVVTLIGSGGGGTAQVELDGVDMDRLQSGGIRLLPPNTEPGTTATQAAQIAVSQIPPFPEPADVKETVLARLVQEQLGGDLETLVYVVNIDPMSVSTGQPDIPLGVDLPPEMEWFCPVPAYYLSFVDATTGEWMFSGIASRLNEDCPVELREILDWDGETGVE